MKFLLQKNDDVSDVPSKTDLCNWLAGLLFLCLRFLLMSHHVASIDADITTVLEKTMEARHVNYIPKKGYH